ncbi:MAG: hypothetical protein PHQ30_05240, partial [Candidatus Izemoplasmatales bacterium]|nr:hypothetical protein [Candidatus Izemoplasmatales bacterium]
DLFDRMTSLRTAITNFKASNFMNQMKEFNPIAPPIMKTNVIMKNPDFRTCFDLWILMDSIDQIGFDIEVFERDIDFDATYLDQVYNAMMVLYATIGNSQKDEFIMNQDNPFEFRQERRPKVAKTFPTDIQMEPGQFELQNNSLNQYYLDQIKKSNYSRFKTLKEAGISVQESIDIIFKQINNITNAVYEDYIQSTYDPQSGKTLEENIKIREDILAVYRLIEDIKRNDIREVSTNRAIALLELRNLQDQKKAQIEAQRLEQLKIKEEEKKQVELERKAKEKAKLDKLKQIERAKKVLENAEKARKEKALRDKEKAKLKALAEKEKAKQAALEAKALERQRELEAQKAAKIREQELRDQAKKELEAKLHEHRILEQQLKAQAKAELKARLALEKAESKDKPSTKNS